MFSERNAKKWLGNKLLIIWIFKMSNNAMKQQMRFGQGGTKIDKDKIKDYAMNRVIAPDRQDEEFWLLLK